MDPHSMAAALGRVPSGLFVLTVGQGVEATGMLTSWVQQCSFDPPQISIALKPDRHVVQRLATGAPFVLNQLAVGQTKLLAHFGKGFSAGEPAFTGIELAPGEGPPVLAAALGHLHCIVVARFNAGDHDLITARVTSGRLHVEGQPYVHIRKSGLNY